MGAPRSSARHGLAKPSPRRASVAPTPGPRGTSTIEDDKRPNKRAKTAEPSSPTSQKDKGKAPKGTSVREGIPRMWEPFCEDWPAQQYINPTLIQLFADVEVIPSIIYSDLEDEQEFRAASVLLWNTFSAYQRGCSREKQLEILQFVEREAKTIRTPLKWAVDDSMWSGVWNSEHDIVVRGFVERVRDTADKWIASDAGNAFVAVMNKQEYVPTSDFLTALRRMKNPKPDCLKPEELIEYSFKATPQSLPESKKGIMWDMMHVLEIFRNLTIVCPVASPYGQTHGNRFL
jgi:hypothetical protein